MAAGRVRCWGVTAGSTTAGAAAGRALGALGRCEQRWRRGLEDGRRRATMGNDGERWGSLRRHEGGCRARLRTTQGSAGRQQSVSQCRKQRSRKTGRAVRSIGGAQQQQRQRQRQRGRNHGAAQRQPSGIISFGGEVGVEPEVAHKMDGLGGAHWAQALADKLCARCSLAVQMVPT
jgi:hypothetical protein